jgi:hypothetical protein
MDLIQQIIPGVSEGALKLAIPFTVLILLLIITAYISATQAQRMPNLICLIMIVCAVCMVATGTTFLDGYDMLMSFVLSLIASYLLGSIFTVRKINIGAPFYKYFCAIGLYLGIYNIINIALCIIIFIGIIAVQSKNESQEESSSIANVMLLSTVITVALIVLIQLNIIPLADSVVNLYPVL